MPDRFQQVEELLHAALERGGDGRDEFLHKACAGDANLEQEVRELLASHRQAEHLLDRPAAEVVARSFAADGSQPRFEPGTLIGSYEIRKQIGFGGMGEVYLATDKDLRREIALKVLPASLSSDPHRLSRFQREAEFLASLNHPNIAAVYGLENADGVRALVMELVEGPTLADRIEQGPLAVTEALAIASQIADALEAAHERGIVHRDLKPANVKVRPDGTVKVLDFGLAKALASSSAVPDSAVTSPAFTRRSLTIEGAIIGTVAYMSPEQATGRAVDQRSDIWAFGCVLYEMLGATRAFPGDSVAETLANVLAHPPALSALPPATPPRIVRLLRRCLEKDAGKRLHHIADARIEIEDAAADGPSAVAAVASSASGAAVRWALAGLLLGTLAIAALWFVSQSRLRQVLPVVRSVVATLSAADVQANGVRGLSISPDGRRIVYRAGAGLQLRALDDVESQALRGSEGGVQPAFSPDGSSIAFFVPAQSAIKRLSLRGGPASLVTTTDGGDPRGLSWGPDDTIVFATTTGAGLWRVRAAGGTPQRLTTVVPGEAIAHTYPVVLPNGRAVLFEAFRGATSRVGVASLDGRHDITYPVAAGRMPRYAPTGHLLYVEGGTLWAIGFDASRLSATGDTQVSVIDGVHIDASDAAAFDVAATGSLIYVPAAARERDLVWVTRDGHETPLDLPARNYATIRISPDGTRIAADVRDGQGSSRIVVTSIARPGWTKLPASGQANGDWFPKWTPDGLHLVFAGFGAGAPGLYEISVDGTGPVEPLLTVQDSSFIDARGWSCDGQSLFFTYGTPATPRIGLLAMRPSKNGKRTWRSLSDGAVSALAGPVSPDGQWIVTERPESGSGWNLYIERFPMLDDRQRITTEAGGVNAVWSPDGRELFYRRGSDGAMMAVSVKTTPGLTIGTPRLLFEGKDFSRVIDSRGWDVAPDGHFLMLKQRATAAAGGQPVVLVQNWF